MTTAPLRVGVASLVYETNSFCPGVADLEEFTTRSFVEGPDVLTFGHGIDEIAGAAEVAAARGLVLVPTTAAGAASGPTVTAGAAQQLIRRLLDGLAAAGPLDAVYLRLHGAMVSEDRDDVEGDILEGVRALVGPGVPIAVSCDLHCHFTDRMAAVTPLIAGYQTCPHIDFVETGRRAMNLLAAALDGATPVLRYRKVRMMASSEGHDTERGPLVPVIERLHAIEREPGVLDATVFLTQPWLDVRELGWTALVVTDGDPGLAQERADELAGMMWDRREDVLLRKTTLDAALERIRVSAPDERPFIVADGADSCSAGAAGDGVVLLSRLLESPIDGPAMLIVTDEPAATACHAAGVGATVTVPVGATVTHQFFSPTSLTGRVVTLTDGRFRSLYPPADVDVGPTAVVETDGGIAVVITTRKANQLDYELYRHVGLDLSAAKLVQVKSAGGYRAFYEPLAFECIDLATPGPADSRLPRLPFTRPWSPLFPFDESVPEPFVGLPTPIDR